jgi:hypothetical protein
VPGSLLRAYKLSFSRHIVKYLSFPPIRHGFVAFCIVEYQGASLSSWSGNACPVGILRDSSIRGRTGGGFALARQPNKGVGNYCDAATGPSSSVGQNRDYRRSVWVRITQASRLLLQTPRADWHTWQDCLSQSLVRDDHPCRVWCRCLVTGG